MATFAWLLQMMPSTSCACAARERSAWRSAAVASSMRPPCASTTRQRVEQREIAPVAGGVQRRRRLGDVLADDGGVADLLVAEPELVVREADGSESCASSLAKRAAEQRDRARLVALRKRDASVQRARGGEERGRQIVAGIGRRPSTAAPA
jgi:hypothetical protein